MNNSEKEIRNLESIAAEFEKITKDTEAAMRRDEADAESFNKAIDGYVADFKSLAKNYEIKKDPIKKDPNANATAEAHQEAAKAASGSSNEDEKKSSVWRMLAAGAAIAAIGIGAYLWVNRGSADEDAE